MERFLKFPTMPKLIELNQDGISYIEFCNKCRKCINIWALDKYLTSNHVFDNLSEKTNIQFWAEKLYDLFINRGR